MQKDQGYIGCPVLYYPGSSARCEDENRVPLAGMIVSIFEGNVTNIQTFGDGRSENGGMQTSIQCCEGQENTPGRWRRLPMMQAKMVRAGCLLASQVSDDIAPDAEPMALPDHAEAVANYSIAGQAPDAEHPPLPDPGEAGAINSVADQAAGEPAAAPTGA